MGRIKYDSFNRTVVIAVRVKNGVSKEMRQFIKQKKNELYKQAEKSKNNK